MRRHRTQLLTLLMLLAGGAAMLAFLRFDQMRGTALARERDLGTVHRDLAEIIQARAGGPNISTGKLDSAELTRRLNSAAVDAGVLGQLAATESGSTLPLPNSDYSELTELLRFEKITLKQLTVFFHQLALIDPGSHVKSIELSPSESAPAVDGNGELWTADIAVAYLLYSPKGPKPR